jgi:hypothetical protein
MDEYTQALLDLNGAVGELRGEMTGIGREIHDIKEILKCKTDDCTSCRKEIDDDITAQAVIFSDRMDIQDKKIQPIENQHTGENAVKSWTDSVYVKIGAGVVTICSIAGLCIALKGGP